ncbi:hypothetical protein, partial [Paenibacillus naphthalenovorans]|uniref:hypothetical protein n=1 Tax=Paenibacillus naphthalenovorans TaxID=162209 RepID=UPI001BB2054A
MKDFLNEIRRPINISLSRKFLYSTLIFIAGIILGIISKLLEGLSIILCKLMYKGICPRGDWPLTASAARFDPERKRIAAAASV